jgi:hypothetical protein
MKEQTTAWGVGPGFAAYSVLWFSAALVLHAVSYPLFVIEALPYGVLVGIGLVLVAIGMPVWVAAAKTVDRA